MSYIHPEVLKSLHDEIDQLKAENATLKAQLAEREWQPIETAPKDTRILVYAHGYDLPDYVGECQWHEDAGFCVCELRVVTHWMPLPTAPKQEG